MDKSIYHNYAKEISKYKPFTKEEEREYFKRYQNKDDVKSIIFNHYAGLVIPIAKFYFEKCNVCTFSLMDLIEYGNMGLIEAIDKFDLSYNCRFSTIAIPYIKLHISQAIEKYDKFVRIPTSKQKEISLFYKQVKQLTIKLNREPTNKEIAEYINKDLKYVLGLKENFYLLKIKSLNESPNKKCESNFELLNLVDDKCNVENEVIDEMCYEEVNQVLNKIKLTFSERQVLKYRYDFLGVGIKTYEEIAKIFGISRQCVHQAEKNALRKIRKSPYIYELALLYNSYNEKKLVDKTNQTGLNLEKTKKI